MIEAAKLYERQTRAQRRTTTPRIRNGAIGQAGIQLIEFLARVIDYSTGALFPSLHTIMDGTGLSTNCVVQELSRLKDARIKHGSEPCRGRVWQYVLISVVAVPFKKKLWMDNFFYNT